MGTVQFTVANGLPGSVGTVVSLGQNEKVGLTLTKIKNVQHE
jgi:hypothetical protein